MRCVAASAVGVFECDFQGAPGYGFVKSECSCVRQSGNCRKKVRAKRAFERAEKAGRCAGVEYSAEAMGMTRRAGRLDRAFARKFRSPIHVPRIRRIVFVVGRGLCTVENVVR